MSLPVLLAGRQPWLTYAAGVGCGVGALYILWRWSLGMMSPMRAALAVLLGSLVAYHVQRTTIFNHNTVQLLPMAGYWWMLWRVLRTPSAGGRFDWLWLGDPWFTGAVVLHMDPDVQLLIDGDPRTSPWLPPDALAREGGMVLILDTPEFRSEGALLEPLLATASCSGSLPAGSP